MQSKDLGFTFKYKPGRTVEELELERLMENLNLTYTERFKKLTALIRVTKKLKIKAQPLLNGHS